jgi:hypothetical protein
MAIWAGASTLTYDTGIYRNVSNLFAADFIIASDARLKKNVVTVTDALSKVKSIRGVTYNWNDIAKKYGKNLARNEIGVVAQEVNRVAPEAISMGEDGYLGVAYDRLVALLIEAVKELSDKVEALEKK